MSDPEPAPEAPTPTLLRVLSGRIGKYEISRPLGKGAMGVVYLAHDTVLERDVALKVMSANIADDPELKQRFEREAKAVARMTHPNVVSVFDLGQHSDGSLYIAMELLKGQDLQKAVRTQPPMSLERRVGIVLQTLAGLYHAHQAGIVHRDVKPANIFLNVDGSVKIMDFGVARLTTASMTGTGNVVGTADYMSPEQVKGAKVDGRSDLFSAGAVLFELLTGRRPFHADNLMAIFYKITHDEPDFELVPGGAEYDSLLPVLRRALAKNLDERYPNAYEFADDLRGYLAAHSTSMTGRHVLEELVGLEPPTLSPATRGTGPGTGAGSTLVDGDTGSRSRGAGRSLSGGPGSLVPTLPMTTPGTEAMSSAGPAMGRGAATLGPSTSAAASTLRGPLPTTQARPGTAPRPPTVARGAAVGPRPRPAPEQKRRAGLYAAVGVVVLGGAVAAWWFLARPAPQVAPSPASTLAVAPPSAAPTPLAVAAPVEPPPTVAPVPTFAESAGAGAAQLRVAQAAFARGDYDRALSEAQAALRADPADAAARALVDNALAGQKAHARVTAGAAALAQGDFVRAQAEADGARTLAPWDERAVTLLGRVREAQERAAQQAQEAAQKQAASRVTALLEQADGALSARKYDDAAALYDQALALDPHNARASLGRTGALAARAAQSGPAAPAHAFVSGQTVAKAAGTRTAGSLPPGFEDSPEASVRRGSQGADMAGKIQFEVSPTLVKPGERYTLRIALLNEGSAPIQIARLTVTTAINGRKSSGPVTPSAKEIAPQQRAVLHTVSDLWSDEITAWSMEIAVDTARGERYTNQLNWK